MATNFFERQTVARRNTGWLVWIFVLAVAAIIGTTYLVAWLACTYMAAPQPGFDPMQPSTNTNGIPLIAAAAAAVLILMGSLFKTAQLRGGGSVVAEQVGGRQLMHNTSDPLEQRVLNVVEEMALASGVPVPPVYLMNHERGINAFAAGYSPSDAVVTVTRGSLENLSRDELQGVIAHEFSHILNGDMRLNIRLIGVLNGILLLGLVGQMLFRVGAFSGGRSRNGRGGGMYIVLIGLAFVILGFMGTLLGNLIKAAVSRQREYLADSSAVQFTRNPAGIAGALKKIGGLMYGSLVRHPNAAEASHMYFATGVGMGMASLMATHPPLDKRILRIDPQWDGTFPKLTPTPATTPAFAAGEAAGFVGAGPGREMDRRVPAATVSHASRQVGNPTQTHRRYAGELVASLPKPLVEAVHEPYGARAVLYGLLLDRDASIRQRQLERLNQIAAKDVVRLTMQLVPTIDRLDVRARLPLVDMSLPALRAMSASQYRVFVTSFEELVKADERLGLFEWTLHHILLRHLKPKFEPIRAKPVIYYGLGRLSEPCSVLLSTLALVGGGGGGDEQSRRSFNNAQSIVPSVKLRLLSRQQCTLPRLQAALETLAQVSPKLRKQLVDACAACICADREITVHEVELLRAVCDMLDCPMPPLLPGQSMEPAVAEQSSAPAGI